MLLFLFFFLVFGVRKHTVNLRNEYSKAICIGASKILLTYSRPYTTSIFKIQSLHLDEQNDQMINVEKCFKRCFECWNNKKEIIVQSLQLNQVYDVWYIVEQSLLIFSNPVLFLFYWSLQFVPNVGVAHLKSFMFIRILTASKPYKANGKKSFFLRLYV